MSQQALDDLTNAVVANYLESTGRSEALEAFLVSIPRGPKSVISSLRTASTTPTLQSVLLSHMINSANPAALSITGAPPWNPAPSCVLPKQVTKAIRNVHASNVLSVTPGRLPRREFDTSVGDWNSYVEECIITTGADKSIKFTSTSTWEVLEHIELLPPSPVLSVVQHPNEPRLLVSGNMAGGLVGFDLVERTEVFRMKAHQKYVVRTSFSSDGRLLATASYDHTIHIHSVSVPAPLDSSDPFAPPLLAKIQSLHKISLNTNPEALLWVPGQAEGEQWLIYSKREDCFLRGVKVPQAEGGTWEESKWNTNVNGDEWVSFDMSSRPRTSTSIHSHLPPSHLANQRLQLPTGPTPPTLSQCHFFIHHNPIIHTTASNSPLVTPRHVWLSDGSSFVLTGDDGCVTFVAATVSSSSLAAGEKVGAHGPAAPMDDVDDMEVDGRTASMLRERKMADMGSAVVRDVCVLPEKVGRGVTVVSVGFDWTVKVIASPAPGIL